MADAESGAERSIEDQFRAPCAAGAEDSAAIIRGAEDGAASITDAENGTVHITAAEGSLARIIGDLGGQRVTQAL